MNIRKRSILVGRRLAVLLGILSLSATLLAQPAPRPRPLERGELVETHFVAQALAGNLLGDPTEQPVSIYLPPGYGSSPRSASPPSIFCTATPERSGTGRPTAIRE